MSVDSFLSVHDGACYAGKAFARQYKNMSDVWENCKNPRWLLWIVSNHRVPLDDRAARLFACWCAEQVVHLDPDPRVKNAIRVARRFANGRATQRELEAASEAASWAASEAAQCDKLRSMMSNPFIPKCVRRSTNPMA